MSLSLGHFVDEILLCVSRENGPVLAKLLSHNAETMRLAIEVQRLGLARGSDPSTFREVCCSQSSSARMFANDSIGILWKDLIAGFMRVSLAICEGDSEIIVTEQVTLVQILQRIFTNGYRWMLPFVYKLNEDLWGFARVAASDHLMEEAARVVNKSVTICLTDRSSSPDSRKWGTYRLVGLLFRIYFHIDQLNLCNNVLRAMGAADLPVIPCFPASHVVTFRFFLGRYYFVNENYVQAEEELSLAFEQCHSTATHNKRLLLHFLIPLRLLLAGKAPSLGLLQRYDLEHSFYTEAIKALRLGNLQSYTSLLNTCQSGLLALGTFSLWEKLILVGYRSLCKQVYSILDLSTRIPIEALERSLQSLKLPMCTDEVAFIFANLIDKVC